MKRASITRGVRTTCATLLCFSLAPALGQDMVRYHELTAKAFKQYDSGDFLGSARSYSEAFATLDWKGTSDDRYNAACSWALAGVPDSAFFQLQRIVERMNYSNLTHIKGDTDLHSLHSDSRWERLIADVKANKERLEANYDKPLVALLDSIYNEDQALRRSVNEMEATYGRNSPEMEELWKRMSYKDSLNLVAVESILEERGWLGPDVIGPRGNNTLFLVIQHANLTTQIKYLPVMREAVKHGRAQASSLALLEDRVLMRTGELQLYGSQIARDPDTGQFYLSPVEDPDHLDERRASVGLGPIAEYLARWSITWDVEAYKKELPKLEKLRIEGAGE